MTRKTLRILGITAGLGVISTLAYFTLTGYESREFNVNAKPLNTLTSAPMNIENRWGDSMTIESGQLVVPENYDDTSSDHIEVAFAIIRTKADAPLPPVFFLTGGPGPSGINVARSDYFYFFKDLAEYADVVLIDYRGAGRSIPSLECPNDLALPTDITEDIQAQLIAAVADGCRDCATYLRAGGIDLGQYHALNISHDLDRIRNALGYDQISLYGYSFGTLVSQVYLREYEDRVTGIVMAGPVAPDLALKSPRAIQSQFERMNELVQSDPRMVRYIPDFITLMQSVHDSLKTRPVHIKVPLMDAVDEGDGWLGNTIFRVISWFRPNWEMTMGDFHLQMMMQDYVGKDTWVPPLPAMYYQIANGQHRFVGNRLRNFRRQRVPSALFFASALSTGFLDTRQAMASDEESQTVLSHYGTSLGRQQEIREAWGIEALGPKFLEPIRSDVPVLFIGGDLDGTTPLVNVEVLKERFPDHQQIIINGSGHNGLTGTEVRLGILAFLHGNTIPFPEANRPVVFQSPVEYEHDLTDTLFSTIVASGIEAGLNLYDDLRVTYFESLDYVFDFGEFSLNDLGYRLLQEELPEDAIAIFGMNALLFPEAYNAWDSFAEGHLAVGDTVRAVELFRMSIALNFFNGNAHAALGRLGEHHSPPQTGRWTWLSNLREPEWSLLQSPNVTVHSMVGVLPKSRAGR